MKSYALITLCFLLEVGVYRVARADLPDDFKRQFGIEAEYASIGPRADQNVAEEFEKILELVRSQFKGYGQVTVHPWNKYSNAMGTIYASYRDPMGRIWEVAPERVNPAAKKGWDGYEFISPPLSTAEDHTVLKNVIREVDRQRHFIPGAESSNHISFDISHLIKGDGNAAQLVDTIIFIENHWPEIYTAVHPERMGGIVNSYTVPLAANQKDLLNELGELPRDHRSLDEVRSLFLRHAPREAQIANNGVVKQWKYRSANYAKLLKIGYFAKDGVPIIEFRIPDLRDYPAMEKAIVLLGRVIERAHQIEPEAGFKDPFVSSTIDPDHPRRFHQLDEAIRQLDPERYKLFLNQLGLNPQDYPNFYHVEKAPNLFECLQKHLSEMYPH